MQSKREKRAKRSRNDNHILQGKRRHGEVQGKRRHGEAQGKRRHGEAYRRTTLSSDSHQKLREILFGWESEFLSDTAASSLHPFE